jgi:phosphoglycerol transferase MdoB-like AlkP superfamily enzyme
MTVEDAELIYALANTDSNNMKRVSELLGRQYSIYDVFNVPMIIHIPGMDHTETISTAGGHLDVLPTLLPLLGIRNDKSVMFGQNLIEAESGLVCQQTHLGIGSFISDEVYFSKPQNNIKGNYDAYEYGTIARLDPDLFAEISDLCTERILDCAALLERNDILLD